VDPVPDPLLFFGSAENRTRASGSVAKNSVALLFTDHNIETFNYVCGTINK
jgi:hypothetical protein